MPTPKSIIHIKSGSKRFSEFVKQVDLINTINLQDVCDYEVKTQIEKGIGFRPFFIVQKKPRQVDFSIYRVRKNDLSKGEDINTVTPFSIPPDAVVKRERANTANKAVFYASNNMATAIAESRCSNAVDFYLSVWSFEAAFSFIDYLSLDENYNSFYTNLYMNRLSKLREMFSCYTKEDCESLERVIQKQSAWFLRETDYSVSSYIANKQLYETDTSPLGIAIEGILYPSIAVGKQAVNFAIGRHFAENNLRCLKVFHLKLGSMESDHVEIRDCFKVGDCFGGRINWRALKESDLPDLKVEKI